MRVLLLNQTFYPDTAATSQQTEDLAKFLIREGCTVTVVTGARGYENRDRKFPSFEIYQNIEIHRVGSTGLGKRSFMSRVIDGITFELALVLKLFSLPKQDVVVGFTSPPLIGLFATIFCLLRGGRAVQWMMDVNPDAAIEVGYLKRNAFVTRLLVWLFEFSVKYSQHVIVLDRWMREKLISRKANPESVVVIPPWPVQKIERSSPVNLKSEFRKEYGVGERFVVMYSGNHSIVHPLDTVLATAKKMKSDNSVAFVFVGGGLRVQDVTQFKEQNGLNNIIQIAHQPREKLKESLSAANFHVVVMGEKVTGLVHTSKLYGILATGRPYIFVGPKSSHVCDLMKECPDGFHVEHGDVDGFVKAISCAKEFTQTDLTKIADANATFVERNFSSEISLRIFYDSIIAPFLEKTAQSPGGSHPRAKVV